MSPMKPVFSPAAGTAWVMVLAGAVGLSLFGDMLIYVVLPVEAAALGFSPMQVGVLLSVNRWVRLISNGSARRVLERRNTTSTLSAALCVGAASTMIYAFSPPFILFLSARALWGVCWSFIRHAGVLTTVDAGRREESGGRLGVYHGVVPIFFVAGTLGGALFFERWGYRAAFLTAAALSLLAIPAGRAALHRLPVRQGIPSAPGDVRTAVDWSILVRAFITSGVGTGLVISTLGFVLNARFGGRVAVGSVVTGVAALNGFLIAVNYGVNGVGSPLAGRWIDRIGLAAAQIAGFSVGIFSLGTAAVTANGAVLIAAVVLFFVATVACRISVVTEAGVAGGGVFSRTMTASDLGAASGPLLGWFAIEAVESAGIVFVVGASLYGVAVILAILDRTRGAAARG